MPMTQRKIRKLSSTSKRVQAELSSLADGNGIVGISIHKLAERMGLSEMAIGISLYELTNASAVVVVRASYNEGRVCHPKTYRVIPNGEMLARQSPNVIPFVPRKAKAARPPMPYNHLKGA